MENFSELCMQTLNDAATSAGLPPFEFRFIEGRKENYWRSTPLLGKPFIDIYVYRDEAGYMLDGKEWIIFEHPDFSTKQELIQRFVTSVVNEMVKPA